MAAQLSLQQIVALLDAKQPLPLPAADSQKIRTLMEQIPGLAFLEPAVAASLAKHIANVTTQTTVQNNSFLEITMADNGERLLIDPVTRRIAIHPSLMQKDTDSARALAQAMMIGAGWNKRGQIDEREPLSQMDPTPLDSFEQRTQSDRDIQNRTGQNVRLTLQQLQDYYYGRAAEHQADLRAATAKGDTQSIALLTDYTRLATLLGDACDKVPANLPAFLFEKREPELYATLYTNLSDSMAQKGVTLDPFTPASPATLRAITDGEEAALRTNIDETNDALLKQKLALESELPIEGMPDSPARLAALAENQDALDAVTMLRGKGVSWIGYRSDMTGEEATALILRAKQTVENDPSAFTGKSPAEAQEAAKRFELDSQKLVTAQRPLSLTEKAKNMAPIALVTATSIASLFAVTSMATTIPATIILGTLGGAATALVGGATEIVHQAFGNKNQVKTPGWKKEAFKKGAKTGVTLFGATALLSLGGAMMKSLWAPSLFVSPLVPAGVAAGLAYTLYADRKEGKEAKKAGAAAQQAQQEKEAVLKKIRDVRTLVPAEALPLLSKEMLALSLSSTPRDLMAFCHQAGLALNEYNSAKYLPTTAALFERGAVIGQVMEDAGSLAQKLQKNSQEASRLLGERQVNAEAVKNEEALKGAKAAATEQAKNEELATLYTPLMRARLLVGMTLGNKEEREECRKIYGDVKKAATMTWTQRAEAKVAQATRPAAPQAQDGAPPKGTAPSV